MLARFATGASFSTDCKGGGRESNLRFLPFMIQMASYLVDQGSSNQQQRRTMAKSVASYLSPSSSNNNAPPSSPLSATSASDSPGRSPSSSLPGPTRPSSEETVQFMMVCSLLSESYEDWSSHRLAFLQRGIYHAFMQHKHGGRSSSTLRSNSDPAARSDEGGPSADSADTKKLFAVVQPMLVYTGLIEQLQQFFKLGKPSSSSSTAPGEEAGSGGGGGGSNLERWEVAMKERMVNMKEMVGLSKEMLEWLEYMTTAADLQEAFDVMGVLGDVLSGGFSRCEDFVRESILTAKS